MARLTLLLFAPQQLQDNMVCGCNQDSVLSILLQYWDAEYVDTGTDHVYIFHVFFLQPRRDFRSQPTDCCDNLGGL